MFCTEPKTVIAAKQHQCTWCGQLIEKGESHSTWKSVDDTWFTSRMHPECEEALDEDVRLGGETEYLPFDNDRPTTKE